MPMVILNPFYVAAAVTLTTEEQSGELLRIDAEHADDPLAFMAATSDYLIEAIGLERIRKQAERIRAGEVDPGPVIAALIKKFERRTH